MTRSERNGRLLRLGGVAAAVAAMIALASQLGIGSVIGPVLGFDARYAMAGDVKTIQADILELRREAVNREYLEFQREAQRRPLTNFERERAERLRGVLLQLDQRLQKIGRVPEN